MRLTAWLMVRLVSYSPACEPVDEPLAYKRLGTTTLNQLRHGAYRVVLDGAKAIAHPPAPAASPGAARRVYENIAKNKIRSQRPPL